MIALWVWSYQFDKTSGLHGQQLQYITHGRSHTVWSKLGAVHVCVTAATIPGAAWDTHFAADQMLGFGELKAGSSRAVRVPYWSMVMGLVAIAIGSWKYAFRWRFSLRTIMVVTMFVAVMLGMAVSIFR